MQLVADEWRAILSTATDEQKQEAIKDAQKDQQCPLGILAILMGWTEDDDDNEEEE